MANNRKFIAVMDGVKPKVVVENIKQTDGSIKRNILGLSTDDNIPTLDTYLDLVKLLASTANKYVNKMFFIKNMKDFDKYEPTAAVHFKDGESGLIYFDNDKTSISATGSGTKHFIKIETEGILTVGTWNDLNAKITAGEKNKIYKVEDMAGYPGFADNEHAFWYLNGTTTPDLVSREHGIYSSAADELLLNNIQELTFSSGSTGTPGSTPAITFGDLSQEDERHAFMENALEEQDYSFKIGSVVYHMVVKTKVGNGQSDADTIIVEGFKYGDASMKPYKMTIKRTGISNDVLIGMEASKYEFNTVKLPGAYDDTEGMPKSSIEQMILDNNASIVADETDPTWQDLDGTQSTVFNPAQITITLTDSGIVADEYIQFLLGSNAGNLVLDASVKIYDDVTEAARNGNVAGSYKWYAYAVSATEVKFVMEDSTSGLTDTAQNIAKVRRVSPNLQKFTAHYTSQAAILKGAIDITGLNKGASQTITLPAGLTTDKLTGISLTVSGSTDWYEVEGWDKVTAFYISVSNEAASQIWWVEYKIEAVPGDKTKLKVTNFSSGNAGTENQAYNAHWLAFKGGK